MEFSNCKWCGKQLDARNGDECYQCFVARLEVERNPEIARKVLAHLTKDAPDFGDALAESELSNDELDPLFDIT